MRCATGCLFRCPAPKKNARTNRALGEITCLASIAAYTIFTLLLLLLLTTGDFSDFQGIQFLHVYSPG